MGCQTEVELGHNLTFTITTHDPDTGVLTDADFAPTYRVYEEETAAAILTGAMAALDPVNTVGFYSELIACTAVNGFETGKSYNIYIEAQVDGDVGGISYGFRCTTVLSCTCGSGSIAFTYTVTDIVTGLPLDGVHVWISTDLAGANIIWHGYTDAFGIAYSPGGTLPMLDPGTYYFWKQLAGYDPDATPDTEVVS